MPSCRRTFGDRRSLGATLAGRISCCLATVAAATSAAFATFADATASEGRELVPRTEFISYSLIAKKPAHAIYISQHWDVALRNARKGHVLLIYQHEMQDPLKRSFRSREYAVTVDCSAKTVAADRALQGDLQARRDGMRLTASLGIKDLGDSDIARRACSASDGFLAEQNGPHGRLGSIKGFEATITRSDFMNVPGASCRWQALGTRFTNSYGGGMFSSQKPLTLVRTADFDECRLEAPFGARPELATFAGIPVSSYLLEFCDGALVTLNVFFPESVRGAGKAVKERILDTLVGAGSYPSALTVNLAGEQDRNALGHYRSLAFTFDDWEQSYWDLGSGMFSLNVAGAKACTRVLDAAKDIN